MGGINAGPAVRKYARELEIDLTKILPTGRNNKITKEDLIKFIHSSKDAVNSHLVFTEDQLSKYGEYIIEEQSKYVFLVRRTFTNFGLQSLMSLILKK